MHHVPHSPVGDTAPCPVQEGEGGTYLGTSDAISTREATAAGSTLRGTGEGSGWMWGVRGLREGGGDVGLSLQGAALVAREMLHRGFWGGVPEWVGCHWGQHQTPRENPPGSDTGWGVQR